MKWTFEQVKEMHDVYTNESLPLDQVGYRYHLSHERVRQLFKAHGLHIRGRGEHYANQRQQSEDAVNEHREDIIALYKERGNAIEVARELKLPRTRVAEVVNSMPDRYLYQRRGAQTTYSEDALKDAVKMAADMCGEPLTLPAYRSVAVDLGLPSELTLKLAFGSFIDACEAAKVKHNPARGPRENSITPEQCIEAVAQCMKVHGTTVTFRAYSDWARENGAPSGITVRVKVGWKRAKQEALETANAM